MEEKVIEEVEFKSLSDLINFVIPIGKYSNFENYIFRGESKEYPLLPSFLRGDVKRKITNGDGILRELDLFESRVIDAEYRYIRDFYIQSDLQGLNIPEIVELRKDIITPFYFDHERRTDFTYNGTWIPEYLYEITGIAQHYGVPTRFIDWSLSFHTALFFACEGITFDYNYNQLKTIYLDEQNTRQLFFIIWALNSFDISRRTNNSIEVIRPRYTTNSNLTAQKGVFTFRKFKSHDDDALPLDKYILDNAQPAAEHHSKQPLLYRLKVPVRLYSEALEYLQQVGVSEKTLFPGFEGVARYIKRKQRLGDFRG